MITFRQKNFMGPVALLAHPAVMGGTMIGGMIQTKVQGDKAAAQQEEIAEQQERMQKQTQKALDRVASAAKSNPANVAMAADVISQRGFSAIKTGGQVVYEFARGLNRTDGGNQVVKKIGHGLALGTTMAGLGYVVDKAIQKDRKNLTGGAELPQPEPDPEKRQKTAKKLLTGAALAAGTAIAARKGAFGKGFQNLSHGLNSSGQKINKTGVLKNIGQEYKKGFKEQFITKDATTGKKKLNKIGTGFTLLFPGITAGSYILGERKQLKDQTKKQKQYADVQEGGEKKSKLKKALIGTAITAGTIAAGRRGALGTGVSKALNNYTMQLGKAVAGKSGRGKLGNAMMESGAKYWGKAEARTTKNNLQKAVEAGKDQKAGWRFWRKNKRASAEARNIAKEAARDLKNFDLAKNAKKLGEEQLKAIKSGEKYYTPLKTVASGASKFLGTGGSEGTQNFLKNMATDSSNSAATQKVAKFFQKGPASTVATIGAVGVGSLAFKPFDWGDKAVKGATRVVDKNAFAYEKSKEQEV